MYCRFKNRCHPLPKYNCLKRNPCFPTLCEAGKTIYPGIGANHYVTCDGQLCIEEFCPPRQKFNSETSECEPSRSI